MIRWLIAPLFLASTLAAFTGCTTTGGDAEPRRGQPREAWPNPAATETRTRPAVRPPENLEPPHQP